MSKQATVEGTLSNEVRLVKNHLEQLEKKCRVLMGLLLVLPTLMFLSAICIGRFFVSAATINPSLAWPSAIIFISMVVFVTIVFVLLNNILRITSTAAARRQENLHETNRLLLQIRAVGARRSAFSEQELLAHILGILRDKPSSEFFVSIS